MKTTKGSLRGSILAMGLVAALAAAASVTASAVGRVGYSGNPATGGGQTCTVCHGGGAAPTVAFHGPTTVVPGVANVQLRPPERTDHHGRPGCVRHGRRAASGFRYAQRRGRGHPHLPP